MKRRELMLFVYGAMTAGRALRAEQKAMPVIGYLGATSPGAAASTLAGVPPGIERNRVCRGAERRDRIPLG